MKITNPQTLCYWILSTLDKVPGLNERMDRKEIIEALDRETLESFFSYDTALGLYVHGGEFESEDSLQKESVAVAVIIGCRNLSSASASLGTGDDSGAWQLLEAVRQALSGADTTGTNIQNCNPVRWSTLLSKSDLAVLGLDLKVRVTRSIQPNINTALDTFGAGYGGKNEEN